MRPEEKVEELKRVLLRRLEKRGIEPRIVHGFIRDLAHTILVNPNMNPSQVNKHLQLLGWHSLELDYHTLQVARACFEAEGLKSLENEP